MMPYSWKIQPSGSKPWMMRCLGFRNALLFHLLALHEAGKEMIWMIDYLEELGKKQREKILQVDS